MDDSERQECCDALGVSAEVSLEELERVYMRRNFALIKGKTGAADDVNLELAAQRQVLRSAYERLAEHLREQQRLALAANPRKKPQLGEFHPPKPTTRKGLLTPPVVTPRDPADDEFVLLRFDNWKVNTFVPPLLLALVWLVHQTPLKFFLQGFHVWMHEFGHATAAWLCGFRALPLPLGWTPVEPVYSPFVYWGLLLLFGILFVAGAKERKVWPMIAALLLAGLQYYMTWRMPEHRQEFWWGAFGGVGGEFYLSTLFMMSFWVQLPEKFKWGGCRYVFFLIGATAFLNIWIFWGDVYRGIEEIPFGSMIHGEEDAGGDMNKLTDDYGWKKFTIRRTYWLLGWWCWLALGVMWAIFALRLNKVADWVWGKFSKQEEEAVN
jgi:hypothetical protein